MKHEWSAAVRSAMEDIDASTPAPPPFRRIASAHSESVRRSRRHVGGYAVVLGLATATLLVVVLNSGDEKKVLAPTQTTTPTDVASTGATVSSTVQPTDSVGFTFGTLSGLSAVDQPQRTTFPGSDEVVTAWSNSAGVSDGYLLVRDVAAPSDATGPEGDVSATPIAVPSGKAWLVTDNGVPAPLPSSATRIMWWRGDGRLWVVSDFGLTPDRLTVLALAITSDGTGTLTLNDPSMRLVGTSRLDALETIKQAWKLDGQTLVLAVSTGGLAQALADVLPTSSIAQYTVAGEVGYKATLPNGQVNLIWPTDDPVRWASLIIAPPLADRVDEIAAAVIRA